MAGAVGDEIECVGCVAGFFEDRFEDGAVVGFTVGSDEVGLADAAAVDDGPDGAVVVVDVDPVAHVLPGAVELGA